MSKLVKIKPFVINNENLGLEKYDQVVFAGCVQKESVVQLEENGVVRYITGLNPFAPEIKRIRDPEEKSAKIGEIVKIVTMLEAELASNILDPEDPLFWSKVEKLSPNSDFFNNIEVECGSKITTLDPENPHDYLKIHIIKNAGFSLIAPSYEAAQNAAKPPKWFLDEGYSEVTSRNESRMLFNKAIAKLESLYESQQNKLRFVAKAVDADNSIQYRKSLPIEAVYDNMNRYLDGLTVEKSKERAAETFLKASRMNLEELKIKGLVRDCIFYGNITTKADGNMVLKENSNAVLGKTPEACVEHLKQPINQDVLELLMETVKVAWEA